LLARGAIRFALCNLISTLGKNDMKSLKLTAALLALAMPSVALAAVDGTLGATSTGNFGASIVINPNTDNYVQVRGLQDLVFPTTTVSASEQLVASNNFNICLTRNTQGYIKFAFSQAGSSGTGFELTNSDSGQKIPLNLKFYNNIGQIENMTLVKGETYLRQAQPPTCIPSSTTTGHRNIVGFLNVPANYNGSGQFSGVIDILLMPE
jgi:hypothetical protein